MITARNVFENFDRLEALPDLPLFTAAQRGTSSGTCSASRPVEIFALLGQGRGVADKGPQWLPESYS
jgi:hypothetical protein